MDRILFTENTVIKQQPIQSSQLPSTQRQTIPFGTVFPVNSYLVPSSNPDHFKFTLQTLKIKGFSTWFAFAEHVQILEFPFNPVTTVDAQLAKQTDKTALRVSVSRQEVGNQQGFLKLVFNVDTLMKRRPVDGTVLNEESKQVIPAGTELVLLTSSPDASNIVKLPIQDNHIRFTLKDLEIKGFSQDWYAFAKHVGIQRVG